MILPNEQFWKVFKETPGALSTAEALCIIQIAAMVEGDNFIELGVNRGKSALAASQSLPEGKFYLIEPEFSNEDWHREVVNKVFRNAENHISPEGVADYSVNVLEKYAPYSWLFWDSGEHGGEVLKKETELIENAIVPGGIICSHDIGNQFHQQKEAMDYLVSTGKYEWIPIDWNPIFDYVKEHSLEDNNNSWHVYPELPHPPNFVGAVKRK